jgi:hypothetical protein
MKKYLFCAAVAGALTFAAPAYAETLTNEAVIALLNAGLGDEVVIAKINASATSFDLTTERVIELKNKGISGPVLAAMISSGSKSNPANMAAAMESPDPMLPRPSGVYMWGADKMKRIESTTSRQARTSGMLGYMMTGGLSGMRVKAAINGPSARLITAEKTPVFYFYFDQAAQGLGAAGGAVTSPNEFSLVAFEKKPDKREAVVGSVGLGGAKSGLRDKDQREFSVSQIAPGIYKVVPSVALLPGEYGFIAGAGGQGANATFRVFDFAVN